MLTEVYSKSYLPGSYLIRLVDGGPWSHCGFYDPDTDTVIEAAFPQGVVETPMHEFKARVSAYCFKHVNISPNKAERVLQIARLYVAKRCKYDWRAVLWIWFGRFFEMLGVTRKSWYSEDAFFCSEFLEYCKARAGYQTYHFFMCRAVTPRMNWLLK